MATSTGKVRIFELAKEVGLTSKELIALFNDRLGGVFEAKNQLSVVPDQIADLVRSVLKPAPGAKPAPKKDGAAAAAAAPPATPKAPADGAGAAEPPAAAKPAAPAEPPVPRLKPVSPTSTRPAAPPKPATRPAAPPVVSAAPPPPPLQMPQAPSAPPQAPAAAAPSRPDGDVPRSAPAQQQRPPAPPRPAPKPATPEAPIPRLKPVPHGQSSIQRRPPPPTTTASASPGPSTGMPGRPGVAPRPGQAMPGQGGKGPVQPGQQRGNGPLTPPGQRRPAGNGPFRPMGPGGPRPMGPRPGMPPTSATDAPAPSTGGRPGDRPRSHEDKAAAKKDREKELLLEKERQRKKKGGDHAAAAPPRQLETIEIPDLLTVQELATSMIVPVKDVITELIKTGTMATINQNIPSDVAINVAKKFGFNAVVKEAGEEVTVEQEEDKPEMMTARPPVVTVLGHVDHGKTSLLDKIRSANVAAGEAGGITQKIGAYTVERNDRKITFIDTPGHEAFTAMRARGAKVTDVAILVVAADDGVMPQTKEAIAHVKAAGVPIVVAINKMDKADAQPDRVKQQLSDNGLQPVDWGGTIEMAPVSARTGDGIDSLLDTVLLEADIKELKANKNRRATGVVIESQLSRGRGAVATVLVQNGTLRVGDIVVVGGTFGKVRALIDDKGKQVKKAGPSIPVEVMGLQDVPSAGDTLTVVSDERVARETAEKRKTRRRDTRI
ncbi:MAG: translation initiation factor IF-2, partial [Candidatus Eremiobacteraeota bacterium]|nr:translation initiation factor IF-2 [Candidatus Eremiobacteraeota bacterium]